MTNYTNSEEAMKWGDYHSQKDNFRQNTQKTYCKNCHTMNHTDFNKSETYCPKCGLILNSTEYQTGEKYKNGGFSYEQRIL